MRGEIEKRNADSAEHQRHIKGKDKAEAAAHAAVLLPPDAEEQQRKKRKPDKRGRGKRRDQRAGVSKKAPERFERSRGKAFSARKQKLYLRVFPDDPEQHDRAKARKAERKERKKIQKDLRKAV